MLLHLSYIYYDDNFTSVFIRYTGLCFFLRFILFLLESQIYTDIQRGGETERLDFLSIDSLSQVLQHSELHLNETGSKAFSTSPMYVPGHKALGRPQLLSQVRSRELDEKQSCQS